MRSSRMAAAAGAAAAALALVLSACGSDSSSTSNGGSTASGNSIADKAKNDKELNIGVKPDQPGLGLQSSSGEYSGFDVDVATERRDPRSPDRIASQHHDGCQCADSHWHCGRCAIDHAGDRSDPGRDETARSVSRCVRILGISWRERPRDLRRGSARVGRFAIEDAC